MSISLVESLPHTEVIKIKTYLESGDKGRIEVAYNKIDVFLKSYLFHCKFTHQVKKLEDALSYLETVRNDLIEHGADNVVIQTVVDKFKEYKEIREKINKMADNDAEKEKLVRGLKVRNLWEIK